jgi:hypothetical protein
LLCHSKDIVVLCGQNADVVVLNLAVQVVTAMRSVLFNVCVLFNDDLAARKTAAAAVVW